MKSNVLTELPDIEQLEKELVREKHRMRRGRMLRGTVYSLIVAAAIAVLLATAFFPVLQIYGSSMTPTVNEGEIVVAIKGSDFECGDVAAMWYGNKLLVKRIIAGPGQWVNIDDEGSVYVDDVCIDEPYIDNKTHGECNIELPYQVPEGRYFVLGDHRGVSQDSRSSAVGCIAEEQIVGRLAFRVWPLDSFGKIG